jgi:fission process protein 1
MTNNNTSDDNYLAYIGHFARRIVGFRPFAYTSEVGEAVRPVVPKHIVTAGYALSIAYILGDIGVKLHDNKNEPNNKIFYKCLDLSLWHTSASLVVPAVTIHTIVAGVKKIQNTLLNKNLINAKYLPVRFRKVFPTVIGLSSIFFIIHPIDHGTDIVMDKFIRPCYSEHLN